VTVGEGHDGVDHGLAGVQQALVEGVAATGTPTAVVLGGRVQTFDRAIAQASAVLLLFPPGEEGGNGLADALTGAVNRSGRLPVSLARAVGQVPASARRRAGGGVAEYRQREGVATTVVD